MDCAPNNFYNNFYGANLFVILRASHFYGNFYNVETGKIHMGSVCP